ncbi:MAG: PfaD family polyunsaturated fatty acid/polyketide biosynthesis protein [Candidatus Hydrogenedens sp.]|nr:PfaD family polyunsaturated fatty acid/polyketide biosynthesis protein [Candidatus Hydrogenedens sp.]
MDTLELALRSGKPVFVLDDGIATGGCAGAPDGPAIRAYLPPLTPQDLGDASFRREHGLDYNYYTGAMANGIGSEDIVESMAAAGMLGFFGAAGLSPARIEAALERVTRNAAGRAYGFNLINSPGDPVWQEAAADLYLKHGVRLIEASAYVALSLPLVKYRVTGIHRDADGRVVAPNRVIAKLSRVEVAERFFSPPPDKMLAKLVEAGAITAEQAAMAAEIPMAQDVTIEADSGGHTDHRPALTALPSILALRDAMQAKYPEHIRLRVGLGGGIGTPASAAAAFTLGAAYIVTGSINQACVESGSSDLVRGMLAKASQTDVGQAPAADMFEMGVTVQVLSKGTRFVTRGAKLFQLYKAYDSIEAIPAADREKIEKEIFRTSLDTVWADTQAFFTERDPAQLEKAEKNARHKMSLVFRWYLGQSSRWANAGVEDRQEDFQIWCGPSMGAFNEWTSGTPLEAPENRRVAAVARELLSGACVALRGADLQRQGIAVPASLLNPKPVAGGAA